jgi:hypothetical protein
MLGLALVVVPGALALLLNATQASTQTPPTGQDKVRLGRFDKEVDELRNRLKIPGLSVVVLKNQRVLTRAEGQLPGLEIVDGDETFHSKRIRSAKDRDTAWQEDLIVARDVFLPKDRSYSPEARRAARDELERALSHIGKLTDQEVVASLARAAALSDNAHTRAYLLRNRSYWRRYPIRIWKFSDGWHVVAGRHEAASLVRGRVTHIGGVPVEQAFGKVRGLYAGNNAWADYMASYTLTSPDALMGVGVLDGEAAEFTVRLDGAQESARLRPEPLDPRTTPAESWWFLSPAHPAASGWTHALDRRRLPQFLISPATPYLATRCAGDVLYVRYTRSANVPGHEPITAFGEKVLASIAARPPEQLVLDLRFNTGGNLQLVNPFIERLASSPLGQRQGTIAFLMGPSTFSAGITAAAALRARSRAVLVGAHPGDRLNYWSEGGNVTLPNSGIDMHYADGLHQYSDTPVPADVVKHLHFNIDVRDLEPDVPVRWTWREYVSGIDPLAIAATGDPLRCAEGV